MKPCKPCYWLFSFSTQQIANEQSKIIKSLFKPPTDDNCLRLNTNIALILQSLLNNLSLKQFESECNHILKNTFNDNFDNYLWISVVFFSMFMRCNFVGPFELTEYEIDEWDKWFKYKLLANDSQLTSFKCHEWLRIDNEDIEFELKYPFLLILSIIILQNGLQSNNNNNNKNNNNKISLYWWYVRIQRYHQIILSNRCPTLQNEILKHCKIICDLFPESFMQLNDIKQQISDNTIITLKQLLQCQFNIEYALIANFYWKHDIVKTQINLAKQCVCDGFIYELSSKLGKRTKWQIDSKSQLYLCVHSSIYKFFAEKNENENENENKNENENENEHYKKTWYLPLNIPLEDDTLLDGIKWDNNNNNNNYNGKLHYLEYCILLFEAIQHRIINRVKGISEIIILSYLDRLNLNDNIYDWCIQIFVLLQRCQTEFNNYNKQTRAIQQYESIQYHFNSLFDECRFFPPEYISLKTHIKLYGVKMEINDNNINNVCKKQKLNIKYGQLSQYIGWKRLCGIYGTLLKSHPQIQCELGDLYMKLGFTQNALTIYEKLKHFHKVATCLVHLDRKYDAKKMLLKQLEQIDLIHSNENGNKVTISHHYSLDKKPYYLCLLGDITENNKYYQQAWNISNKTYGRAMRTLAYNYYHKQQYKKCIECAQNALKINSLFPKVWFILGSASMKIKPPIYKNVIESFSFVIRIDNTDFEAWNNLGAAHMNLKNYKSALYALKEAGNLRRDNWRIWENILTCSLKLKKLSKSISTLSHLIQIKKDTMSLNPNVIAVITIELTKKIQKYHPDHKIEIKKEEKEEEEDEDEKLSETTMISLMNQFDKLIKNILNRLSEYSFMSKSSHIKESPFTKTGLKNNDNMLSGISENIRGKQIQYAYDIYEIFSIYFEKLLRIDESIEIRFKQLRIIMKYFENICKIEQNDKVKNEYLKVIHVLNKLTFLYSLQINVYRNNIENNKQNDQKLDIQKLQQTLTSIQLFNNRLQKLSEKMYIDFKQSKDLIINLEKMEQLTYKIKNKQENTHQTQEKESIVSAFSDWM